MVQIGASIAAVSCLIDTKKRDPNLVQTGCNGARDHGINDLAGMRDRHNEAHFRQFYKRNTSQG